MKNRFEIKESDGKFHFVLKAENGQVILSSEMYNQKHSAIIGIDSVKLNSADHASFEMNKSTNNKDYFVMKAKNGEVIGTSEMYESKQGMLKGIDSVMENAPTAPMYSDNVIMGFDPLEEE
tara:strand:+ start:2458 stop:2820 length:363 start_codon:yes stop_codon:yes gene_type:complete